FRSCPPRERIDYPYLIGSRWQPNGCCLIRPLRERPVPPTCEPRRPSSSPHTLDSLGSSEGLTLTSCRGLLDRVQHAMACDRVVERGAEMRALAIVAGKVRVSLGNVCGRTLRRRPPVLLRHRQHLERGLCALAAADGHLEDLGLATVRGELQIAVGAVDLPEQVRAARLPAAIVDRESGAALEQSGDRYLVVSGHRLAFALVPDCE